MCGTGTGSPPQFHEADWNVQSNVLLEKTLYHSLGLISEASTCTHSGGVLLDTLQVKPVRLLWFEWYPSSECQWYLKNYAGEILVGLFCVSPIWRLEIGDKENLSYRTCPTQKWKRASRGKWAWQVLSQPCPGSCGGPGGLSGSQQDVLERGWWT